MGSMVCLRRRWSWRGRVGSTSVGQGRGGSFLRLGRSRGVDGRREGVVSSLCGIVHRGRITKKWSVWMRSSHMTASHDQRLFRRRIRSFLEMERSSGATIRSARRESIAPRVHCSAIFSRSANLCTRSQSQSRRWTARPHKHVSRREAPTRREEKLSLPVALELIERQHLGAIFFLLSCLVVLASSSIPSIVLHRH